MYHPATIAEGVYVDARNIFAGLAAAFLSPSGAITTFLVSAGLRWNVGGVGMESGIVSLAIATGGGLAWRWLRGPRQTITPGEMILLAP